MRPTQTEMPSLGPDDSGQEAPAGSSAGAPFARVAVPLPIDEALTYSVPEAFAVLAQPGARARVRVGQRRVTGVILELASEAPEGTSGAGGLAPVREGLA